VGVQVQPQHAGFAELRDVALELEEMGVDTLFVSDHFLTVPGEPTGRIFECWTTLSALAEATSRVRLGPLVSCTAYRNANLLAHMARTVDHVSSGRLILGLGAGWFEPDYEEYEYDFGTTRERLTAFSAALGTIESRLGRLNPPPVQTRIPILIGGAGEKKMLALVAEHADVWNVQGDVATFRRKNEILDTWCEALGRPAADIERSVLLTEQGQHEHADDYADAGATHVIVGVGPPPWDLEAVTELLAWRRSRLGP
jgi:probable F420-dependent oxidoreductase